MYNILYPLIQNVQVPGTSIKWFLTPYSGKSMDGAESDYAAQNEVQILVKSGKVGCTIKTSYMDFSNQLENIKLALNNANYKFQIADFIVTT